jgi:hypothetical protein
MSDPTDYLLLIGIIAVLIGGLLLWRMAVEVNTVLPGRISLLVRKDWSEVRRLHQKCFPTSRIRVAFNVLGTLGTAAFILAIILRAKSK